MSRPELPLGEKLLILPCDFAYRQEVRLLGRHLSVSDPARSQFLAPHFALRLWLFWAGKGTAHQPWLAPGVQSAIPQSAIPQSAIPSHPHENDPLTFLIAEALQWPDFARLIADAPAAEGTHPNPQSAIRNPQSDFTPIALALQAGILIETVRSGDIPVAGACPDGANLGLRRQGIGDIPVAEEPATSNQQPATPRPTLAPDHPAGLILKDFAFYNPHLAPGFKPMQRRGGEARARFAALKDAAQSGIAMRKLLEQSAFTFPSETKPTEAELNAALGLIRQFYCALDWSMAAPPAGPRDAQCLPKEWPASLIDDAVHLVRSHSPETQFAAAEYVMTHRQHPPLTEATPEYCIRHFATLLAAAARGK